MAVDKAKRVLDAERKAVLDGLRDADERFGRLMKEGARINAEIRVLLIRGKVAGVPVTEMAKAADVTRQHAHHLIREAEKERSGHA